MSAKEFDRITHEPGKLGGKACIRGIRISVAMIVSMVANGVTTKEIIESYPILEEEDIKQALQYAASLAADEIHSLTGTEA